MPRVSLVGDGHGGSEDYATLSLWWTAESGTDYGSAIEAQCLGNCGSNVTISGSTFYTPKIYTLGVVYDGTNESSLAVVNSITISTLVEFSDFYCGSSSEFAEAFAFNVDSLLPTRLRVVQTGASRAGLRPFSAMPNTIASHIVVSGGRDCCEMLSAGQYCQVKNTLFFGSSDKGVEASGGAAGSKPVQDSFAFNNVGLDFDSTQITTTTCASEDTTGDLTGYTSAELVNFAGNDFRTKSASVLATAGTGTTYIGAFLEAASGTTGTITQTAESFTQSAAGTITSAGTTGSITQTAQSFTQTLSASLGFAGLINQTTQSFTQSLVGTALLNITGDINQTLNSFTQSVTGAVLLNITGTITQTVSAFTQSASGVLITPITGLIVQTVSSFTMSAVGKTPVQWVDKIPATTSWSEQAQITTTWTDQTGVSTIWTDKV